jgi:glucokinase
MILAGDIGGTKTILTLFGKNQTVEYEKTYQSSSYEQFSALLNDFLGDVNEPIRAVCLGIAGPVEEGRCITTNLPWEITRHDIAQVAGTDAVFLLNDLEATAWGVLGLPSGDFVTLNAGVGQPHGHVAVLAAGTGLGEALVVKGENSVVVVPTEGGHTDFGPRDEQQIGLLRFLLKKYPDHVSYERIVSGPGLVSIYEYLLEKSGKEPDPDLAIRMQNSDPAVAISEFARVNQDFDCLETLRLFACIYGAEAGNLALKCLPKGGVVLAGGMAPKLIWFLGQNKSFMQGFLGKGRYESLLEKLPVSVCMNQSAALLGAYYYARDRV